MSQPTDNAADLETLELYLDRELADADAAGVDARLADEPALRTTLDRLRRQRAVRLEAMSTAFDTDALSVERLVLSVRNARAAEIAARQRRAWWRPNPSYFAAAACVAFGLVLGVQLQRQNLNLGDGQVATPASPAARVDAASIGYGTVGVGGLRGHGAYVVSIPGPDGRERMKVRLNTAEQVEQFVRLLNQQNGASRIVDVRIEDDPF